MRVILSTTLLTALGLAAYAPDASACGCFAPPSPAEPVVQAGERIVFAHEDGKVVAHIQIQFQGDASEFAWLVPVPKVPELRLGSEELFTRIQEQTNPQFVLNRTGNCGGGGPTIGCAGSADFAAIADEGRQNSDPVAVEVSSAGPYDYAVVRADEKQPMVDWLNENRFFVPAGTAEAMDPYIRPGAYFLALKLRAGETVGSLQPVVLEYEAELPMIPIILTSVAAVPDMGVLVWVLGESRAIPHNYQHVEINEEHVDWINGASNYGEVVARAIDEADGGHAFVTEFAGSTQIMEGLLDPPGRFGSRARLEALPTLSSLLANLVDPEWPASAVTAVLALHYPMPDGAALDGLTAEQYYGDLARYVDIYDPDRPFDAAAIVADLWERIVEPTLEAGRLFRDHPKMTRLFTALDPEEMSKDPVFAFNPDLPDVARVRSATLENTCGDNPSFIMHLGDGRSFELDTQQSWSERDLAGAPRARVVEVFRMEGSSELVVDNRDLLAARSDGADAGGCQNTAGDRSRVLSFGLLFLFVGLGRRLMRRRA